MTSSRTRTATAVAWLLGLSVVFVLRSAGAQSIDGGVVMLDASNAPAELDASVSTPPRVIELALPSASVQQQVGTTELLILIDAHGGARLDSCDHDELTCTGIQQALDASSFEPARVGGAARASRVRLRFPSLVPDAGVAVPKDASAPHPLEYGATARIEVPEPGSRTVTLQQLREVPGTFGDPFRILDALPGVVPVLSGLPYAYVRGAPPAATAYFYDDLQMPALYHLALGPGVIHPAMISAVDFHPGVAPARYGRKTGGVLTGVGSEPGDALHGELELRPIDVQGYLSVPLSGGASVQLAGRYGYPGLALKIFDPKAVLQYWDYQLRTFVPAGHGLTLSLIAVGSFDLIGERKNHKVARDLALQFHRVEARAISRRGGVTLGGALGAGYEQSGLGDDLDVSVVRFGPRLWLETDAGRMHLRLGADMLATFGRIQDRANGSDGNTGPLTELQDPRLKGTPGRNVIGVYLETQTRFTPRWRLNAGLRSDVWLTGPYVEFGAEPRLSLEYSPTERLRWHASAGLANQAVSFPIPLPGIADAVLQRGLQRSLQTELGARLELPSSFSAELSGYFNAYRGLLTFDAIVRNNNCDTFCASDVPRADALAYGAEFLLRRSYDEKVSGWIAYTLGQAYEYNSDGHAKHPNFDVRHVLNAVLQWRLPKRWQLSLRAYARSGRFALDADLKTDPRLQRRLPGFIRGDLQLSRTWPRSWGELRLTFDWLNFTLQREATSWECKEDGRCKVANSGFPITIPMIGLRGTY